MHFAIQNVIIIMNFEWDENKNRKNIIKHKVDFNVAIKVFLDENHIERYDEEHSAYEDRYIALGLIGDVVCVVFIMRDDNIRIISARHANEKETEEYYDSKS